MIFVLINTICVGYVCYICHGSCTNHVPRNQRLFLWKKLIINRLFQKSLLG